MAVIVARTRAAAAKRSAERGTINRLLAPASGAVALRTVDPYAILARDNTAALPNLPSTALAPKPRVLI
jgi:hypothetical protein